jgi:hypothetical protein
MMSRIFTRALYVIGILGLGVTSGYFAAASPQANAASVASDWRAGQIIDDGIFFNSSDMTVEQIQAFLNSKVPTCDTQGTGTSEYGGGTRAQYGATRGHPAPFVCLKDYYENPASHENNLAGRQIPNGAMSAAQIIKNAADTNGISVRALLVMIQKESPGPLITDTWPFDNQYTNALGFGCPDTAACDPQYAGFANQVQNAARQFTLYQRYPDSYRHKAQQNNTVLYSPTSSCGSGTVFIKSIATAGLYNYTPYQPNQAALNNLYGSGDACSAYGNRNFWRMFNDWFGTTYYQFGNISSSTTSYALAPCTIPLYSTGYVGRLYNPDTQDYLYTTDSNEACAAVRLGYIWDDVVFVSRDSQAAGSIAVNRLRLGNTHVYSISNGEKAALLAANYVDEGTAFFVSSITFSGSIPVYGLNYPPSVNTNRFLTSAGEENTYFSSSLGYTARNVVAYTEQIGSTGATLYRLRNGNDRLYTAYATEATQAVTSHGYTAEGTALTVDVKPTTSSRPVYRLLGVGGRLYTTSRLERDYAVTNYAYRSEGTAFYGYSAGTSGAAPIYRSTNYTLRMRLYTSYVGEYYNSQTYYGYRTEDVAWYGKP